MKDLKNTKVIYGIYNPSTGLTKIGYTSDISIRVQGIKSACGVEIELVCITPPCFNYGEAEKQAHEHFKEGRKIGEWFDLDKKELTHYLKRAYLEVNPLYYALIKGNKTHKELAKEYRVSRPYISTLAKRWGVDFSEKIELIKEEITPVRTTKQPLNKIKFKRILPNIYSDGETFVVSRLVNVGDGFEEQNVYFDTLDKAKAYLESL